MKYNCAYEGFVEILTIRPVNAFWSIKSFYQTWIKFPISTFQSLSLSLSQFALKARKSMDVKSRNNKSFIRVFEASGGRIFISDFITNSSFINRIVVIFFLFAILRATGCWKSVSNGQWRQFKRLRRSHYSSNHRINLSRIAQRNHLGGQWSWYSWWSSCFRHKRYLVRVQLWAFLSRTITY